MFLNKKIAAVSIAACVMISGGFGAAAAGKNSGAGNGASSGMTERAERPDKDNFGGMRHGCRHCGTYSVLADLTGKSVKDLMTEYPQQTAWQAAKKMGKLDALKTAYLEKKKTMIDRLVSEQKISKEDGDKIYADLQSRVAKIDGINIVIVGRPNYMPKMKSDFRDGEKNFSSSH